MQIIHEAFKDVLFDVKGSTFISGTYVGPVSMKKTNNPYLGATVSYKFTGALNWNYESLVSKKIEKITGTPVNFKAAPRSWGMHLMDGDRVTPVVVHKGKYYMHVTLRAVGRKTYRHAGHIIPARCILPFVDNPPAFVKSQGLKYEDSIKPRDFSFDNLRTVRLNGTTYQLIT